MGSSDEATPTEPEVLRVGATTVVVEDEGNGSEARRFATWMLQAGAESAPPDHGDNALRIVIGNEVQALRGAYETAAKASPDFVITSARPAFAARLVESIERNAKP